MRVLLNTPSTKHGFEPDLVDIIRRETLCDGARIDVHPGDAEAHHDERRRLLETLLQRPTFFALFLIGGGHIPLTQGQLTAKTRDFLIKARDLGYGNRGNFAIEIGNEPDLAVSRWKKSPQAMAAAFCEAFQAAREEFPNIAVLCPSVSNLNKRGLGYLEVMARDLPRDCAISFHRYPAGREFEDAHSGYESRFDELAELTEIADGRPIWNTETGWAEHHHDYGEMSEQEVASRTTRELELAFGSGLEAFTVYQINSAVIHAGDDINLRRLKSYGLRRPDGSWKPSAEAVRRFQERRHA